MNEAISLAALAVCLAAAIARPRWAPDWVAAALAAAAVVALGALGPRGAGRALSRLGPTVGFLAALLVLADGCRRAGVFDALGALMARGSRGRPRRLLSMVFAVAACTTAVLSLDATIVLLTPVVFATASRLRTSPRPHVYACSHLANSASLVLPVSNLTNLLAFAAAGISFARFASLMALPWLVAIAVEWLVLSRSFAGELGAASGRSQALAGRGSEQVEAREPREGQELVGARESREARELPASREARELPASREARELPAFALSVVALTLAGFALSSLLGVAPVWFAAAGAAALTVRHRPASAAELVGAAEPAFLVFVLGLGVVVAAAGADGLSGAVDSLLPRGSSLPALLGVAAVSAALANLVNNLPATLIVVGAVAASAPGSVLAMLIGVNVGPNLTYVGSLATLLWRRVVHAHDEEVDLREFLTLGVATVPLTLVAATAALWLALHVT